MTDLTTTIDTYLEGYGEPDPARRAQLIKQVWATDGRLVDPPFDATGHDGISDLTVAVHTHYPSHRFRRTSGIDAHHDVARYSWALVSPDGTVAVAGTDIAELEGGRIRRVTGFFGDLPERDD
jgi:hypothetical protein